MGLFDQIKDKIFGHKPAETVASAAPAAAPAATPTAPQAPAPASRQATPAAPAQSVDVAAILDQAVKAKGVKLDWRKSIVDLLKTLDIDSSLQARKDLAHELGYTGSADSAAMNVWLHKQVIQKLKDNGGKVPADLLD